MPDSSDWGDLEDIREATSLFDGGDEPLTLTPPPARDEPRQSAPPEPPALPALVPPTPRMRQHERRRERATGRTLGDIAEMRADRAIAAAIVDNPAVLEGSRLRGATPEYNNSLLQERRDAMGQRFRQAGVTLADIRLEMLDVARTAAAEGEYAAAGQIYKTIAQTLGGLANDQHLHLHQSLPQNPHDPRADFRSASDEALRALIHEARATASIIDEQPLPAATDAPPAPMTATATDASAAQP